MSLWIRIYMELDSDLDPDLHYTVRVQYAAPNHWNCYPLIKRYLPVPTFQEQLDLFQYLVYCMYSLRPSAGISGNNLKWYRYSCRNLYSCRTSTSPSSRWWCTPPGSSPPSSWSGSTGDNIMRLEPKLFWSAAILAPVPALQLQYLTTGIGFFGFKICQHILYNFYFIETLFVKKYLLLNYYRIFFKIFLIETLL